MMCGAPTVECQAAGRWTTSDFRCQSEYVPVVEWMAACLLTKESSVVLTEIEHAMQVVTIEIESQDTIDNHPRLEILLDAKEAKWFKGGGTSWIQLETYKFQADGRITLNITFTADRIEVRTNGILHPKERVDMLEEAYNIVISSSKDTDAIRVSNCCE
ncbi:uncharacterized protein LOC124267880 [Haliotis rubra]|uniref:uncharacterized protein LOC124267880 n=1 Tax=Haliotis rubra TaxID=36100 RepID=UPI001EE5FB6F|nr:uncharacterized protein LOC124267880 [Haliotis rubra]